MLNRIEHHAHNRIHIMRGSTIFHILNPKLSGKGRTNLVNIQLYALNLR